MVLLDEEEKTQATMISNQKGRSQKGEMDSQKPGWHQLTFIFLDRIGMELEPCMKIPIFQFQFNLQYVKLDLPHLMTSYYCTTRLKYIYLFVESSITRYMAQHSSICQDYLVTYVPFFVVVVVGFGCVHVAPCKHIY